MDKYQEIPEVRFSREELNGERGKRIRRYMKDRAVAGVFQNERRTLLELIDLALERVEVKKAQHA